MTFFHANHQHFHIHRRESWTNQANAQRAMPQPGVTLVGWKLTDTRQKRGKRPQEEAKASSTHSYPLCDTEGCMFYAGVSGWVTGRYPDRGPFTNHSTPQRFFQHKHSWVLLMTRVLVYFKEQWYLSYTLENPKIWQLLTNFDSNFTRTSYGQGN